MRRFDPATGRRAGIVALGVFVALLGATAAFLWQAHRLGWPQQAAIAASIAAGLWWVGRLGEGRGYPSEGFPAKEPGRG